MKFRRQYVGIDVHQDGLTLAALQCERSACQLAAVRLENLHGVFEFSSQKPNIVDARRFVEAARRGVDGFSSPVEQIALSLPDRVGRLYLTDVDVPFQSQQEGVDILKWRLKGSLPAEPAQVQLDYQIVEKREDGRRRCVVAAVALPVVEQYENLLNEVSLHPVSINFHSLNLYNFYHTRLELGEEFVLVGLEADGMTLQYFSGKTLKYQRVRHGAMDPEKLFRELNRTLAEACKTFPAIRRCPAYAHLDEKFAGETQDLLSASLERDIKILDPQFKRLMNDQTLNHLPPEGTVAAAFAAAENLV